jgi:hypothetical protein
VPAPVKALRGPVKTGAWRLSPAGGDEDRYVFLSSGPQPIQWLHVRA